VPARRLQHPDTGAGEDGIEGLRELGVPIADEEPEAVRGLAEAEEQVPGCLGDPLSGRARCDAEEVHAAAVDLDYEQHIQPGQSDGLDTEVARQRPGRLGSQEAHPGRSAVTPNRRASPTIR
jgi:hypothetical protein